MLFFKLKVIHRLFNMWSLQIWIIKRCSKLKNICYYIFEEEYGKQIDTSLDFELLETIGKYLKRIENE